jgi:uncharacterized membrane protein
MEEIRQFMHLVSFAIGLGGCLILTYGVAVGFFHWLRIEGIFWAGKDPQIERKALRHQLAYYLLVSLEFLIAADIIDTILEPSLEELAILGGVVVMRTVISFSLGWEMKSE